MQERDFCSLYYHGKRV